MKTIVDLPIELVDEALRLTKFTTKKELILTALRNLISQYKREKLTSYKGKIDINIDLDVLRKR